MREPEYNNAKITGTSFGMEYNGIMSYHLHLEWQGGGISFGGHVLDEYDKEKKKRVGFGASLDYLKAIMETVGVETWEQLPGKYVVVETHGIGSTASGIRNILDEKKWLRPESWFKEHYVTKEVKE